MGAEPDRRLLSWAAVHRRCIEVAEAHTDAVSVFGVPRGGCVPAAIVAAVLGVPQVEEPGDGTLVVDDLVQSGRTAARYEAHRFAALWAKPGAPPAVTHGAAVLPDDAWVVFPWEADETPAADAVVRLGQAVGLELAGDAAERHLQLWRHATAGLRVVRPVLEPDPDHHVVSASVRVTGLCERHACVTTAVVTVRVAGTAYPRLQLVDVIEWAAARPYHDDWKREVQRRAVQLLPEALVGFEPDGACPGCSLAL